MVQFLKLAIVTFKNRSMLGFAGDGRGQRYALPTT